MEDYFQVGAFNQLVQRGEWYRFESRVEEGTRRTLALLDEHKVRATFFVLGWVAEQVPELVREVADRGHEVASKGYYHRNVDGMSPSEFADDLERARAAIERASGRRVLGYRVAGEWLSERDLWVLDVLAAQGYRYDSSLAPRGEEFADVASRRRPHTHRGPSGELQEFPIPTISMLGQSLPIGGGNWIRQLPTWLTRAGAKRWMRGDRGPFVLYFHTWELDRTQPRITAASTLQKLRHYRNLDRMPERLEWYLRRWSFTSVAEHLGLTHAAMPSDANASAAAGPAFPVGAKPTPVAVASSERGADVRRAVTIVVPCHNEELILPYLANTLKSVEEHLGQQCRLEFVFVDDGSTDGTRAAMKRLFGGRDGYTLAAMPSNAGVAAAIMHGISLATSEVVCSIDCDCTYDPHELQRMIPLLGPDVAMVTASPYHPLGTVRNVPNWRLMLSHNLSRLYRLVLRNKLATYTSCFRVYRRSAVVGTRLDRGGFLGVAELLCRLDLAGAQVVEYPATLEVRILGRSKLRVLRIIGGHLVLLARVAFARMLGRRELSAPGRSA